MANKILKIGVTGSAGSGKSLVCKAFGRLGLETLDCDEIARQVVAPGRAAYTKIVSVFGARVVGSDGYLDRAALRKVILAHPDLRKKLESIVQPIIINEMDCQMTGLRYKMEPACAVEVPLLFELDLSDHFDTVVVVTSPDKVLLDRIVARDGVDRQYAKKLLALQMVQDEKIQRADCVITNDGDPSELFQAVSLLYEKLKKSA